MAIIPTGKAAIGKQVTIGGELYPSQEWYDVNVLKKGATKIDTEAQKTQIQAGITDVQEQITGITADVGALVEMDATGSPAIGTNADDIVAQANGAVFGGQAAIDQFQKIMDDLAKQNEQLQKDLAAEKKSITDIIFKRDTTAEAQKSQEELRAEAQEQIFAEMGITPEQFQQIGPLIGQINTYNQQIANLQAQTQQGLLNIEQRMQGMPGVILRGEQALYQKQQNIAISSIAMQAGVATQHLQLLQGAQADANAMTTQIVNAATYQQQQELADMEWSLGAHQDLYNILSSEEQTNWNRGYTLAKDELDRITTEKTNINNLMLQYAGAGITMDDTVDEANKKASEWQAKELARIARERELAGTGLHEELVGGTIVLKDAAGNIVGTRAADTGTGDLTGFNDKERKEISTYATEMLLNPNTGLPNTEAEARASFDALKSVLSTRFGSRGEQAIGVLAAALDKSFPPTGISQNITTPISSPGINRITGLPIEKAKTDFSKFTVGQGATTSNLPGFTGVGILELDENGVLVPPEQTFINNLLGL